MSHEIGRPCILEGFISEWMDININAAIKFRLGEDICFVAQILVFNIRRNNSNVYIALFMSCARGI